MAATIAIAVGADKTRRKEAHRLGSVYAVGEANTWRTFARAYISADGSGNVSVKRDGVVIHEYRFGPEGQEG